MKIHGGILKQKKPLRIGFMPVSDCAPLVYAFETGLFGQYGVEVELCRESVWTDIRDKVINGDLDGAQAPATLPFLANLGLESDPCACVSGLVLSLQGNAIALSRELWEKGVRNAQSLCDEVYHTWGKRTYTFGVASPISASYFLLRQWLRSGGIEAGREIRIVVVPPTQLFPTLKLGYIDGFCVGEPWASLAVQAGEGVCVATSADLAPLHPEKVLMVRQSFAQGRAEEHEGLLAALLEACAACDLRQNRLTLSEMLAQPHYVNAPVDGLKAGLVGPLWCGENHLQSLMDLTIFHRYKANDPTDDKAAWLMDQVYELLNESPFSRTKSRRAPVLKNVFRRDFFERAEELVRQDHLAEGEASGE